jgi:hypothetical protein
MKTGASEWVQFCGTLCGQGPLSMGPIATRSFHDHRQLFVMFLSILSQMRGSFNANQTDS